MSAAAPLVAQLQTSLKYIKTTVSVFDEGDSEFAPQPELYTVAGHIAHAADSVDWFVEGAFGEGWNMDFEALIAAARAVTSLDDANAWLDRAYAAAIAAIEGRARRGAACAHPRRTHHAGCAAGRDRRCHRGSHGPPPGSADGLRAAPRQGVADAVRVIPAPRSPYAAHAQNQPVISVSL